jgi:hypothetical protein
MPKRVLAIGVGGSGKASVTILKERLEETYGQVPDNVVLLAFDTDDIRDQDAFAGTRLNAVVDDRGREPEFQQVTSKAGITMKTVFADITSGKSAPYMSWLEKDKLARILGPSELDIRGGAQQRRPVGRVALYQRWDMPVYNAILDGIQRMYGEPDDAEQSLNNIQKEQSKRLIFIIGSVAGGTGSGFLLDIANLVQTAVRSNTNWQSVDVSAIIVLPDAFQSYTVAMNDPTNLKPNSYAALRELDRFMRTHSAAMPYMIRYGSDVHSITWSTNQPVDHVYLVDTACRGAAGEQDLIGDPMRGVFPLIADFMMAHVDQGMGDALATLRSNAGLHYNKDEGWQYSSFNVLTYIFPVDDVIESFSYRFLREMLTMQYLPLSNKRKSAEVQQEGSKEAARIFSQTSVGGKVNPTIVQKAFAATDPVRPEALDMSWAGLFNLISLSESAFAKDYEDLQQWLSYLRSGLIPTKEGEYRHESHEDGYFRLQTFGSHFMDECLGIQLDPDDEASRAGGQWDTILSRYPGAIRQRFTEALDATILTVLNQRNPQSGMLEPARIPFARAIVASLRDTLITFKQHLEREYQQGGREDLIRQSAEDVNTALETMYTTQGKTFALPGFKSEARKSQEAYALRFAGRMELLLHQRIYRVVLGILDQLGTAERDQNGALSVLNQVDLELENWQATFREVDRKLAADARTHENNRKSKFRMKVRRYLTDEPFERDLYPQHAGHTALHVLGQVQGQTGMAWQRFEEDAPLHYKMVTLWTEQAQGAEEIARRFFAGIKHLFHPVRDHVTIADRLAVAFNSPATFVNNVNQVVEPFLRYNDAANGKSMFEERYVAFNMERAQDQARSFLEQSQRTLADQGRNVVPITESLVACTVVQVARGVRLGSVDQFNACEPEYRKKIYIGRESIHLFPEEQAAIDYEKRIEMLNEPTNRQRVLSPEVVICMGDISKLRAFVLACAYGLIEVGTLTDEHTGEQRTELFLNLTDVKRGHLPLSDRQKVAEFDPHFTTVGSNAQLSRLYLNALQNFVLKVTEKSGVASQMIANLVGALQEQAVSMGHIQNPFTLPVRDVNKAINIRIEKIFGSTGDAQEEGHLAGGGGLSAPQQKDIAQKSLKHLKVFIQDKVKKDFEADPSQRVKDLATVMHLVLEEEIDRLLNLSDGR